MIRKYKQQDQAALFHLMREESEEWADYYEHPDKYAKTMEHSIAYVLLIDDVISGYIRCKEDDGYGIYIFDLLVSKKHRGKDYGRKLMKTICDAYPEETIYVTSDVDPYYEKQGCEKVGSVFEVKL
ncbi:MULTISPECIES: GNAT family N-acetyltransferase [unclassified Breznakia]|uniref:GNAT family N-acetyltransferase n=1 Tax=unclassified Breznakia TaxID=2623764 RepID=UPI0024052DA5|nr:MULTISPECIES: GNAT family N-acetyltransferase [unclassified Breznakia]MDF9837426.1 GNAT superfamily N-acetyltransferase [Breznakia sp. PFB2-8]MDF9859362.1 GNAT superfamily N-acetyltransferase [Breznakia sp. PH5-24]